MPMPTTDLGWRCLDDIAAALDAVPPEDLANVVDRVRAMLAGLAQ